MRTRSRRLRPRLARPPPSMAPPPRPPELIDDAIAEILLRLPPDDPACLVHASLVCNLWRRILSEPTFPHRYREFHQTPPLLGFLYGFYAWREESKVRRFVPITTTRIPFLQPPFECQALDCRHGRVLFDMVQGKRGSLDVWDPITGDHKLLHDRAPTGTIFYAGAVLCAVAGCTHRGCHGGPFTVVLVRTSSSNDEGTKAARAWVYSSETAVWSTPASNLQLHKDSIYDKRGALVGDQIYFLLTCRSTGILKYDLGKHCLTTICLPCKYTNCHPGMLIAMDDGLSLGFAVIKDSTLHLWARKTNPDGSLGWVQDRVILLNNLVPIIQTRTYGSLNVIGFAEGVDILLLGEYASGYTLDLKSGHFKKLRNPEYHYYDVFPYLSFYIPEFSTQKSLQPAETK